jgi:hypothetical protein
MSIEGPYKRRKAFMDVGSYRFGSLGSNGYTEQALLDETLSWL